MTVIKIKERRTDYQITEAFRTIRTNLRFCGRDKKNKNRTDDNESNRK